MPYTSMDHEMNLPDIREDGEFWSCGIYFGGLSFCEILGGGAVFPRRNLILFGP